MAGSTHARLGLGTVVISAVLLASPFLPASLPASAHGQPAAALGYLFRSNGAHFSVKTWERDMASAEGYGIRRLSAEFQTRWHRAKTTSARATVLAWWNRIYNPAKMNAHNLGPVFPPFRDALAVCKRFYGGNKDWKSYCTHWWGSHAFEVTGWQYMPYGESDPTTWATYHGQMAEGGSIEVYGMVYFSKLPADRGGNVAAMITDHGAIQLPVDFPQANRAWLAPDSPLPLIAFYNRVKHAPDTPLKAGANSPTAHEEMAAGQLLQFWGWTAPTVLAPGLWRVMAAAGFNPVQAGGFNVPPSHRWPAWRSVFWNAKALRTEWRTMKLVYRPWGPNNPAPGFTGT